jgi:hypothetical protein
MCPSLHRQLQTHKNVLRLLHEYKLVSTQINGQRILSIQPIRWSGPTPGIDCEIFVGRIPKTIFEDTLYPLFNTIGEVFQIRLMVDMAELTRGYCFIMYTNPLDASRAITQLDQYEISPGKKIRVLASVNKCKLYIGPLPWHIASEEVIRVGRCRVFIFHTRFHLSCNSHRDLSRPGDLRISLGYRVRIHLSIPQSRCGLCHSFLQVASQRGLGQKKIAT